MKNPALAWKLAVAKLTNICEHTSIDVKSNDGVNFGHEYIESTIRPDFHSQLAHAQARFGAWFRGGVVFFKQ